MKFAPVFEKLIKKEDKEVILQYLENKKHLFGTVEDMVFAIRKSNGLSFQRIDVFVNKNEIIFPMDIEV